MGPGVSPTLKPPTTLFTYQPDIQPQQSNTGGNTEHQPSPTGGLFVQGRIVGAHKTCRGEALGLLVPVNSTPYGASISGLSTPWSVGGLNHPKMVGDLILKRASRLDAFSGYPFGT